MLQYRRRFPYGAHRNRTESFMARAMDRLEGVRQRHILACVGALHCPGCGAGRSTSRSTDEEVEMASVEDRAACSMSSA
jgi:hypothetical protein